MCKCLSVCVSLRFPALPHFSPFRSLPRLCSHQHHLHTINGLAPRSGLCCSRCSQKKWPELLLPIDTHKSPTDLVKTPEVTILSVGRWEKIENKIYNYVNAEKKGLHFSPNVLFQSRHEKYVFSYCFLNIVNIIRQNRCTSHIETIQTTSQTIKMPFLPNILYFLFIIIVLYSIIIVV